MEQFLEGAWALRWHILIAIVVLPLVTWAAYMAVNPSTLEEDR